MGVPRLTGNTKNSKIAGGHAFVLVVILRDLKAILLIEAASIGISFGASETKMRGVLIS